jgi:alkylated DNA repair dioxygenase AlkB
MSNWVLEGGGTLELREEWLPVRVADQFLAALREEIPWRQNYVTIAGKRIAEPRLSSWHGDEDAVYTYARELHRPAPWTPHLSLLREALERDVGSRFNSVLANRYRSGQDAMGMHADDERELGPEPIIASVSLGMTRAFQLAPKKGKAGERRTLRLAHGSLLVMGGPLQRDWKHGVPREAHVFEERLNLTFRYVAPRGRA